jgi:hypothetical protein
MSGDYLARLKAEQPDVDWDAEMAAARERLDKDRRRLWNRLRHWAHLQAHRDLHRQSCTCRGGTPRNVGPPA